MGVCAARQLEGARIGGRHAQELGNLICLVVVCAFVISVGEVVALSEIFRGRWALFYIKFMVNVVLVCRDGFGGVRLAFLGTLRTFRRAVIEL